MSCFCTKCGINWAALMTVDDEQNDESYEFCPVCRTDSFLTDAVDGPKYILSVTGKLVDAATGKELEAIGQTVDPVKRYTYTDFLADEHRWQNKQTAAVEAYHIAFEKEGKQAAEQAYFKTLKQ